MDRKTAPVAKIARPVLTGYLARKRLFSLLDRGRSHPALWISGPPGSGKTTLVSSYVESRKSPCVWYQVDEGDADVATFFYYLGLAAKKAAPRSRIPLPLLTADRLPGLSVFTRRFFEDLYRRLPSGAVVVLDNCQSVPPGSPFHETIRDALSLLPAGMNAILVSRSDPPPVYARLLAHRDMDVLGWSDLRLTPEETSGIARLRWKGKGRAEGVSGLQSRADGWAAGLVLLLEKSGLEEDDVRTVRRRAPEEIFDYFAGEVFEKADAPMRDFLVRSAFLPRMTARMAERVTGQRRAGAILSDLGRQNYFVEKLRHAEPVYQYHSLFREFLLSRAEAVLPRPAIVRLREKAAEVLIEAGQAEDAAALCRESGQWPGLCRVIRECAGALISQGRSQTVEEWLCALPAEVVSADPWLLYWMGVCRLPFHPGESRRGFEDAFRMFGESRDSSGLFLAWSGVVGSIIYGSDGLKPLDPWLAALDAILDEYGEFPSQEVEARVACTMLKALALRRPPGFDMEKWAARVLSVARSTPDVPTKIDSLINLAYYRFSGYEATDLAMLLDSLKGLLARPEATPLSRLTGAWLTAAFANFNGNFDRCQMSVSEGIERANATGVHVMDYLLMGQGTLGALNAGDPATARHHLRTMASSLVSARPWEAWFYHHASGWEAYRRGDLAQATLHSERSLRLAEAEGNPWTLSVALVQRALVLHAAGEAETAAALLCEARELGVRSRNEYTRFACLLTEAGFLISRGAADASLEAVREGMRIGRERGFVNLFMWPPGILDKACATAVGSGIETAYALELIRKNGLAPDPLQPDGDIWPWPIRIHAFGRFRILLEGKPIPSSRKVRHKPLLMLKALVALGGHNVPAERITDILWPDADGDLAHQSLATTLRRLRQLLGNEKALAFHEGRLTLSTRQCWVDAWSFERLLAQAEEARRGGAPGGSPEFVRHLTKAVSLYEGPFLAGESGGAWIDSLRERLRGKFVHSVVDLARRFEEAGDWEKAAERYSKGLDVDDLAEEFYRRLMMCLRRLGRTADALAVYHRCRKTLDAALGARPSPETEAVFRSLDAH